MKRLFFTLLFAVLWLPRALAGPIVMNQPLGSGDSPTFAGATLNGNLAMGANTITFTDAALVNKGTNILGLANNTNAQVFQVYNTDPAANKEWMELTWQAATNRAIIRTNKASSGTLHALEMDYAGSTNQALIIPTAGTSSIDLAAINATTNADGLVRVGNGGTTTSTSGTIVDLNLTLGASPSSTSTLAVVGLNIAKTINFSNGTPGAGTWDAIKISITETANPTGAKNFINANGGASGTTQVFAVANTGAISTASTFTSSATGALGWSIVAGANQACNTTCASACVFGLDTALVGNDLVDCTSALADVCVCAGAS